MVTRNKVKKPLRERVHFSMPTLQFSLTKMLFLCFLLIAGGTAYGSLKAIDTVLNVPVEQVSVTGDLRYQDQLDIKTVINRYTDNGFVQVDLEQLHSELAALPWLYRVTIKRQLPNGLLIEVEEQKAAAYWNKDALINQYGDVFQPPAIPDIAGLPVFSGKHHQQVLALYQQLQNTLPESQKPVRELHINHRNTVTAELAGHTVIVMNIQDVERQLSNWKSISAAADLQSMKSVDLRYSNGAAVEWNNPVAQAVSKKTGGHY